MGYAGEVRLNKGNSSDGDDFTNYGKYIFLDFIQGFDTPTWDISLSLKTNTQLNQCCFQYRGKYFSKNPKLFPTPTKTLPQHNDNF